MTLVVANKESISSTSALVSLAVCVVVLSSCCILASIVCKCLNANFERGCEFVRKKQRNNFYVCFSVSFFCCVSVVIERIVCLSFEQRDFHSVSLKSVSETSALTLNVVCEKFCLDKQHHSHPLQ